MPAFALGGTQRRIAQLMNHFDSRFRHTVISLRGDLGAAKLVSPSVEVEYPEIRGRGTLQSFRELQALLARTRPHLLLTYNWGSMDAVAAACLTPRIPLIHAEDGFGPDEAVSQKRHRTLCRRLLLKRAVAVVAPSRSLVKVMRQTWKLPDTGIRYIPNGVDTNHFTPRTVQKRSDAPLVVGSVGQLRPEKSYCRLIDACAAAARGRDVRLVLIGDGPERERLEARTRALNLPASFPGRIDDPAAAYREMDVFALSSRTEQMPISVLEAMASGLPVASTDVGDVRQMVAAGNDEFIVPDCRYEAALRALLDSAVLRERLGRDNRARCAGRYGLAAMFSAYEALYEGALRPFSARRS
jgi:glycosyltransferase involved in cell wall biosynthesis